MKVLKQFRDGQRRMNKPGDKAHTDYDDKVKKRYVERGMIGDAVHPKGEYKPAADAKDKTKAKAAAPKNKKPAAPDETK